MGFTQTKDQSGVAVLQVEGQLIVGNRQELKDLVQATLDRGERRILIDFSRTGYIDSSGLGALVSTSKRTFVSRAPCRYCCTLTSSTLTRISGRGAATNVAAGVEYPRLVMRLSLSRTPRSIRPSGDRARTFKATSTTAPTARLK